MATEGLRRHSTTLFNGVLSDQQREWSGILPNHRNLTNHQISIVSSEVVTTGIYEVYILPDTDRVIAPVNTGLVLDMTGKDSAYLTFTGVIRGLYLRASDHITPQNIRISCVLSSFSRYRDSVLSQRRDDRLDYVSTDLTDELQSNTSAFSKLTPNHTNMVYHQLTLMAKSAIDNRYTLKFFPETDKPIEGFVDTGHTLAFDNGRSAIVRFGGIISGVRIELLESNYAGVGIKAVLSSSLERFDELVYDYIGIAPELDDHLTDYDNPHQTSWDNLLNKPPLANGFPTIRTVLSAGTTLTVPDDNQFLVWEKFEINGGTLELVPGAKMIILHDRPEARSTEPDFTYNLGGQLTQIDYSAGQQKLFTYNGSDQLEQVDSLRDGTTLRKSFVYTGGGELDYITEQWL